MRHVARKNAHYPINSLFSNVLFYSLKPKTKSDVRKMFEYFFIGSEHRLLRFICL